jgi:LPS-assembly lipoprotein
MAGVGLILAPLLGACGFHPLYQGGNAGTVEPQLAAIKIMPIKEHIGQLLGWQLQTDFNPDDRAVEPRYRLYVGLALRQDFLATQSNAISTRGQISGAADCVLTTLNGKRVLYRARIQSIADYDINSDAYSSLVGKSTAEKAVVRDMGEEIEMRLAAYFSGRSAAR